MFCAPGGCTGTNGFRQGADLADRRAHERANNARSYQKTLDAFNKGVADGMKSEAKKVPNPNGKKGGPEHQAKVDEVAKQVEEKGLTVEKELKIDTPTGEKGSRFVDVAGRDESGNVVEMHQVGKQNKGGTPVSREVRAMDDIETATGERPDFHPYNVPK